MWMVRPLLFAAAFAFFLIVFPMRVFGQDLKCPAPAALLSLRDPIYGDEMDFARELERNGFVVEGMFPRKRGSMFQVVDGEILRSTNAGEASCYTNFGPVDVFFLPKGGSFWNFQITERREGRGDRHKFSGKPRVMEGTKFGTALRESMLKHEDHGMLVANPKLRASLQMVLHRQPQTP
jgi:hypothetical protein